MATTKPGQIKIAELDENARLLAVQPGLNEQEEEVPSIRAVPLLELQQSAVRAVEEDVGEEFDSFREELSQIEQMVANPAAYAVMLGETVIYISGENIVVNPPDDDPEAVVADIENENIIFRSEV